MILYLGVHPFLSKLVGKSSCLCLDFKDWEPPTADVISQLITDTGLSCEQAAELVGHEELHFRALMDGQAEIGFAAWHLLLVRLNLVSW